jgi:uncharacterized membrane protein YqjE
MESTPTAPPLTNIGLGQIMPAVKVVLEAIFHRGELVALELSQVSEYAFIVLIAAFFAVAFALLGGFAATFMVASMVWDRPDRAMILGLMAVANLIFATALAVFTAGRLRKWQPFRETGKQLRNDHECLQSILTSGPEQQAHGHARTQYSSR